MEKERLEHALEHAKKASHEAFEELLKRESMAAHAGLDLSKANNTDAWGYAVATRTRAVCSLMPSPNPTKHAHRSSIHRWCDGFLISFRILGH